MKGPIWILFGVIIGMSLYPIVTEAVEYYGKFPPTSAINTIAFEETEPIVKGENVTAISYQGTMILKSDGSILFHKASDPIP